MFLNAIASAFPAQRVTQREAWQLASDSCQFQTLKDRSKKIMEKVLLGDSGIDTRHFAIEDLGQLFDLDAGQLNEYFEQAAPALSSQALRRALDRAELKASEIDALFVCTCTGYLCPGVSSYTAEALSLRQDVYLNDVVGLGCGAAVPTLRAAQGFLSANPDATVAVVAVETCSSAFFMNDDIGVLISLCLFGDGASASIWSGTPGENRYQAGNFSTLHLPEMREKIRFVNEGGKLKNKLHRSVPKIAARAVKQLYDGCRHESPYVISHTGGRDVIEAIEAECEVGSIVESRQALSRYGNTSSPSVLIALEHYLESNQGHDCLWLTSFGAGFACHSFELNRH